MAYWGGCGMLVVMVWRGGGFLGEGGGACEGVGTGGPAVAPDVVGDAV